MINLGDAPEQKEGGRGPIPPKSIVLVKLDIRQPKKADQSDPAVNVFSSGLLGLSCELTVESGQFKGKQLWENWFLPPGLQTITLTKGQEGICNGSFAKMRAAIEAGRGLDPSDPAADRTIANWFGLNGLVFPAKIGCDIPKPGDQYVNNRIDKILTIADEHYQEIMAGGELISTEPLPEIPQAPSTGGQSPSSGWGGNNGQEAAPPVTAPLQQNVPKWAQ